MMIHTPTVHSIIAAPIGRENSNGTGRSLPASSSSTNSAWLASRMYLMCRAEILLTVHPQTKRAEPATSPAN